MANELDAELWGESEKIAHRIRVRSAEIINNLDVKVGGGAIYPFLYFLARFLKPQTIVETGVAAGFSSYAFLLAIKENGEGTLFSSDFPYFRLDEPERFIGIMVEESLKPFWRLYIDGDSLNLPKIVGECTEVDIFHYDSDKSYSGRKFATDLLEPKMRSSGIIIFDDIQDNSFFYDYVDEKKPPEWFIFEFEGKYVGLIGSLRSGLYERGR